MSDGKYFSTTKRGEIKELSEELRSTDKSRKKDGVKKVIAAMTVGKDVAMLFPDVVNCMQTEDLELKKLVYLYLINYSKSQPDLAIMAVNTFVKDSQDPNPLIRSLAVRTMGCIRVDKITEYLCDPLQRCLKDEDPYVRKTAAVCVAKLHDINAELVEDRGFLDQLTEMLQDSNPMVVANAVASLAEIQDLSGKEVFQVTNNTVFKLLAALNECTEWGQVFILDAMATYVSSDAQQAESIVLRVLPRLQHANGAVVMSAIKVIMKQMDIITDDGVKQQWYRKMAPPLVTLLSAEPEVQYVALRNINLIVQKRPEVLTNEVKVFFCKYNDPIYVKMEKLEIMIKLSTSHNIDQVLLEFKEYAQEIDVDFVRKSVRAIGRAAINLESAAERCINVLLELIQSKVNYVVQEAIIVIKDIFRRYPNTYESIIATLCENLDSLDEPEAKASMIWIIGEYAERIDNADELLETFLETFLEETSMVQLQLLTSIVKLFLKKASDTAQNLISLVLTAATSEVDNPDLRDRAYIYWRLLSTDPEAAKDIVLADKPVISDDINNLEPLLLEELLSQMSTLASVYHKPASTFVSRTHIAVQKAEDMEKKKFEEIPDEPSDLTNMQNTSEVPPPPPVSTDNDLLGDLLDLDGIDTTTTEVVPGPSQTTSTAQHVSGGALDLLGDLSIAPSPVIETNSNPNHDPVMASSSQPISSSVDPFGLDDLGGGISSNLAPISASSTISTASSLPLILSAAQNKGLSINGEIKKLNSQLIYHLSLKNESQTIIDGFMIQFNMNTFGLTPIDQVCNIQAIVPGSISEAQIPLIISTNKISNAPITDVIQVALKTNQIGIIYFSDSIKLEAVLLEDGSIGTETFLASWKSLSGENERTEILPITIHDIDNTTVKLKQSYIFLMAHRPVPNTNQEVLYMTCRAASQPQILLELRYSKGVQGVNCACKSNTPTIAPLVFSSLKRLLGN